METKTYTLEEVAKHNLKQNSVWVVIHDSIYDVTVFMDEHPGGEEVLLEQAGKVASEAFEDVGHSTDARTLMKQYKIGELCEADKQKTVKVEEKTLTWSSKPQNKDDKQSSFNIWLIAIVVAVLTIGLYQLNLFS